MAGTDVQPMTKPKRYLVRMVVFLLVAVGVVAALSPAILPAFMANPVLNGLIVGVLVLGIVFSFRQVLMLGSEVNWIEGYRHNRPGLSVAGTPTLLGPTATMLGQAREGMSLSPLAMRSLLDGLSSRLDEARDISRYMIGLLIFLGLLGTFWGLLQTIGSVAGVIAELSVTGGDIASIFDDLKAGLEAPLSGMGTAFSSSLFGLAGSLILGFLDLQASQSQNRFFNEVEEWLSGLTRLSAGGPVAIEGEHAGGSAPAYLSALVEQMADGLGELRRTIQKSEENRREADQYLIQLGERLATLTDQMKVEQSLLMKLAEHQKDLRPVLSKIAESGEYGGFDESSRTHLRNIDVYLTRLVEDMNSGRQQSIEEIRSEIRLLARTIASVAEEERRA